MLATSVKLCRRFFMGALGTPEPRRWAARQVQDATPSPPQRHRPSAGSAAEVKEGGDEDEYWFLQLNTHIVGVQHNEGKISDGEYGELERKGVAGIRVVNSNREAVGWISKEIAPTLCTIFEECPNIRPEVLVPRGSKQKYKVPASIAFCGPCSIGPAVGRLAAALRELKTSKAGTSVIHVPEGVRIEQLDAARFKEVSGGLSASHSAVLVKDKKAKKENNLDISKGFEELYAGRGQYESMPCAAQPATVVTPLLEHQLKALHWSLERERSISFAEAMSAAEGSQVFFWKPDQQNNVRGYRNVITSSFVVEAPKLPRGGLLCDDMGLGKTITMLSLVCADSFRPSQGQYGTLVLCPVSVLSNWEDQAKQHCPSLRVGVFHGQARQKMRLEEYDLVLTTYQTLASEADKDGSPLVAQRWRRLIADEAHELRNPRARQTVAALKAGFRSEIVWGVTGTPIQNRLEDAFSLVALLKIQPFSEKIWFNRCVLRLVSQGNPLGFVRLRMLLASFILRRRKDMQISIGAGSQELRPLLQIPPKREVVRNVKLSEKDQRAYNALEQFVSRSLVGGAGAGAAAGRMAEVLVMLLRLRQLCISPALLPRELWAELQKESPDISRVLEPGTSNLHAMLRMLVTEEDTECSICLERLSGGDGRAAITGCGHAFHQDCIRSSMARVGDSCPLCRTAPVRVVPWVDEGALAEAACASAKVQAVLEIVREASNDDSIIIFSQFTVLLGVLEEELRKAGTPSIVIDGSTDVHERRARIAAFQARGARVALCSLKAAGAGLNLTAANRVVLCDPWWSPAVEQQAVDRCHRIGQTREVEVVRLVAAGTIEEKIRALQSQKLELMAGIHRSREELQSNRMEMVLKLFQGPWVRKAAAPKGVRPPPVKRPRRAADPSEA